MVSRPRRSSMKLLSTTPQDSEELQVLMRAGYVGFFDDATDGKYYNYKSSPLEPVTDWAKAHPVATPLIAAGLTNIPSAGISYAIGSNGEERGIASADEYYRMLMASQAPRCQWRFTSRLANVFGAGFK